MSIASPQNRTELKQYIKTKLGAPVLQINVSDEQMDLAINDAFQYFHERQHFDATEELYLTLKIEDFLAEFFKTGQLTTTTQTQNQLRAAAGMVAELALVSPGSGYAPQDGTLVGVTTSVYGFNGSAEFEADVLKTPDSITPNPDYEEGVSDPDDEYITLYRYDWNMTSETEEVEGDVNQTLNVTKGDTVTITVYDYATYPMGIFKDGVLLTEAEGFRVQATPLTEDGYPFVTWDIPVDTEATYTYGYAGTDPEVIAAGGFSGNFVLGTRDASDASGLTVTLGGSRTTTQGVVTVDIYDVGSGYKVGDQVTIDGGDNNSVWQVTQIKEESTLVPVLEYKTQNNFLVLPDSVIGVTEIVRTRDYNWAWGFGAPFMGGYGAVAGAMGNGNMGNINFDLTSYYTMQQYISTMNWVLFNPISYSFNKRTHRLYIQSENFGDKSVGQYIMIKCQVKPDPDVFPDVWNDMFLKRLATAYVQLAWGRVLTKYQSVALPGGITMNGDQIYNDAKTEIAEIQERFMLDYGDYALDIVG